MSIKPIFLTLSPFWLTLTSLTCPAEETLPSLGLAHLTTVQGERLAFDTSFVGGISVNGMTYQKLVELNLSDTVKIDGNIKVSPTHLDQLAEIVVYAGLLPSFTTSTDEQFYMLGNGGKILAWDQNPTHLMAFQSNVTLITNQQVSLYSGTFYLPGTLQIFFGYRLSDGTLVTSSESINAVIHSPSFTPQFEAALCPFDIPKGFLEGQDVKCGYVAVPETHANPQGRTIRLAVARFPSLSEAPAPDPLVMEQGGPGGSTLDSFAMNFLDLEDASFQVFRQRQDVVLIEQRGTLYSEPFLTCKEVAQLQQEMLNFEVPAEEIETRQKEALTACQDRFQAVGINLSAYNSVENAADMAMVMTALGYDKFNFYGVSYGTMLAQHLMRDYPHRLRSVLLDSVVPLNVNFVPKTANTGDRSLRLLFQKCAADSECNRHFLNLEQVFFDTVDYLNQNPGLLFVKDQMGKPYILSFTGDDFMVSQIFTLLYVTSVIPYLPAIIYQVAGGDYSSTEWLLGILLFDNTFADGMGNSVICAEDADYTDADYDTTGLYPQIAAIAKADDVRERCAIWKVAPLGSYVDNPVESDIPTLILSGEMDPITPPSFGEEAAKYLRQGYAYTFPGVGHGVIGGGECPQSMMQAFLENPWQRPNDSCMATLGIQFATEFELPSRQGMRQLFRSVESQHTFWDAVKRR